MSDVLHGDSRKLVTGRIWTCKIGGSHNVPTGGDFPMRQAIEKAYRELTGEDPDFNFSGWGARLDESERAVAEDRLPDPEAIISECHGKIDEALDAMNRATQVADEGL